MKTKSFTNISFFEYLPIRESFGAFLSAYHSSSMYEAISHQKKFEKTSKEIL
jgi:hypothetical protein